MLLLMLTLMLTLILTLMLMLMLMLIGRHSEGMTVPLPLMLAKLKD